MIFFYEILFVLLAIGAIVVGETLSRTLALGFLVVCFAITLVAVASFDARLATAEGLTDEDRRWFAETRAGVRHLALLLGLAAAAALVWRLIAG